MLSQIEAASDLLEKEGIDPMTMSLDAKKLYQSMVIDAAAKEVANEILETKIEFNGINYETSAIYIAAKCGRPEIAKAGLSQAIPMRRHRRGVDPGVTTKELFNSLRKEKKSKGEKHLEEREKTKEKKAEGIPSMYHPVNVEGMDKATKRKILAKVIEIVIREIMKNHIYKFANKIYKQRNGGRIGLRATGVVAQIVVNRWKRRVILKLAECLIALYMISKYVDDVNLVLEKVKRGYSWNEETKMLEWSKEKEL